MTLASFGTQCPTGATGVYGDDHTHGAAGAVDEAGAIAAMHSGALVI